MPQLPIGAALRHLAEAAPDAPCVTDLTERPRTVSRRELDLRTNRLARHYAALGVGLGDLVTIALPNGLAFVESCVAVWKLGAVPQPVSSRLPLPERAAVIELADSRLVIGVDPADHPTRACRRAGDRPDPLLSEGPLPAVVSPSWKAPTSGGSTGRPKLILAGTPGLVDPEVPPVPYMQAGDTQLVPGPLYHNGPFIYAMRGLFLGHHLVIPGRFEAARTLRLLEDYAVSWVMLVPTMMQRIWRLPEGERAAADLSALRMVLHLAAPCPTWLKRAWIGWLGPDRVWELYAGTEAQGLTLLDGHQWLAHPGSVGRPALGSAVRILDPAGRDVPRGEVGEIYLLPAGGTGSTYRYVGAEPRRTADGWDSLGDLGWLDAEGYLYLADRSADVILTGGSNVYPAEVEAVLDAHPAVRSSVVVGLPDDDLGERVHAIVELNPGIGGAGGVEAADLLSFVAARLVRYKVPRTVELVTSALRDDAGKVRRGALRAERLPSAE